MFNARSRWLVPSCALLVVGLVACGSTTTTGSPASQVPTTQSTTTPSRTPQVIHVGSTGTATPTVAGSSTMAADSESNVKMRPYWSANYVYDGTPPDLTAPAGSWYFATDAEPTTEQIAAVAAALGVTGDVRTVSDDQGGGWMVGPEDYSDATLSVSSDAMHNWYYDAAPAPISEASTSCAVAIDVAVPETAVAPDPTTSDSDSTVDTTNDTTNDTTDETAPYDIGGCDDPEPPTGVPTEDEATTSAKALLATIGVDTASYEFDTYADEWSANVTGYLLVGGVKTSATVSVGYGGDHALTWASGFLGTLQQGGDYDRIGVAAAIERLNDQQNQWRGDGGDVITDGIGATTDIATSNIAAADAGAGSDAAVATAPDAATEPGMVEPPSTGVEPLPAPVEPPIAVDPVPCDPAADCIPVGSIEPVDITLTNAHPSLEMLWADDGTVWLLPGYAFDSTDGGTYSVIAVPDEFIQVDADVTPVPADGDGSTGETVPADSAVAPDAPAEPTDSVPLPNATPNT